MGDESLTLSLEQRLNRLSERIVKLKKDMDPATRVTPVAVGGPRSEAIEGLLLRLHPERVSVRQSARQEIGAFVADLAADVEDFFRWIESDYKANRKAGETHSR